MSESSLSPPLVDIKSDIQELPLNLRCPPPGLELPKSASILFDKGVFSRTLLDTTPPKIQYRCLESGCNYMSSQPVTNQLTSNLWKHLKKVHPLVHAKYDKMPLSTPSTLSNSNFFEPRKSAARSTANVIKYRELLLSFVVSNNLPLRLIESYSFRQLVHHLNPSTMTISRTSIARDLYRLFCNHKAKLQAELQEHVINGGRLALTTDT